MIMNVAWKWQLLGQMTIYDIIDLLRKICPHTQANIFFVFWNLLTINITELAQQKCMVLEKTS